MFPDSDHPSDSLEWLPQSHIGDPSNDPASLQVWDDGDVNSPNLPKAPLPTEEYLDYLPTHRERLSARVPETFPPSDNALAMFVTTDAPPSAMLLLDTMSPATTDDLALDGTISDLARKAEIAKACAEAGWLRRDPIYAERIFHKRLLNTNANTHVRVTLTIWVDVSGKPAHGEMCIAVSGEVNSSEGQPFAEDFQTLDIPEGYWTEPINVNFERHLRFIFASESILMRDDRLWGSRSKNNRRLLRPTVKQVCQEAYAIFTNDYIATAAR
jgi:hypothetical protein